MKVEIRPAEGKDAATLLSLIRALAEFEKLSDQVSATEEQIRSSLFPAAGPTPARALIAEAVTGEVRQTAGFALYFTSYSTFLARPGTYLEDLFVLPEFRSAGIGKKLLAHLAALTVSQGGGRLEWSVLNWNQRAWKFYAELGAHPMQEWTVHRLSGDALTRLAGESNKT